MAVPTVTIATVTTGDAGPTSAPYKVSRDSSKDLVTWTWNVSFTPPLRYWQERLGGTLRTQGTKLRHQGVVCGMNRCGEAGSFPLAIGTSPVNGVAGSKDDIDALMPSEGLYRLGVDARNDDGWSSTS